MVVDTNFKYKLPRKVRQLRLWTEVGSRDHCVTLSKGSRIRRPGDRRRRFWGEIEVWERYSNSTSNLAAVVSVARASKLLLEDLTASYSFFRHKWVQLPEHRHYHRDVALSSHAESGLFEVIGPNVRPHLLIWAPSIPIESNISPFCLYSTSHCCRPILEKTSWKYNLSSLSSCPLCRSAHYAQTAGVSKNHALHCVSIGVSAVSILNCPSRNTAGDCSGNNC